MRDPSEFGIKAWAKEYEEASFFFEESSAHGKRLVAWSEEPEQIKRAFYAVIELLPQVVSILVKICASRDLDGKMKWSRFHGEVERIRILCRVDCGRSMVVVVAMRQLRPRQNGRNQRERGAGAGYF